MARPARALISSESFRSNYLHARRLAPDSRALAVVKANAYGHGATRLAGAIDDIADAFGVACIEEAIELREAGIKSGIVLLEGCFEADEIASADRLGFDLVVHNEQQIRQLLQARPTRKLRIWLKMDTGMHRLGLAPGEYADAFQRLGGCVHVGEIILMTHFARADETACDETAIQMERFDARAGMLSRPHCLANSAAIMAWPASRREWIRPGIMLYGATPLDVPHVNDEALRPVMSLQSQLIATRTISRGEAVGYGARFLADRETRVGVVAMGYADGYPRHAPDGTPVAVDGHRTRLIGRVSMDMLTVDLSELPDVGVGAPVELWGQQISANEVASASGTIAYQLFTGVTRRVPRLDWDVE